MVRRLMAGLIAFALIAAPWSSLADDPNTVSGDKSTDMAVDLLIMRPLGLATTVIGTALTIVALPFTIPSGSVRESAQMMIVEPAEFTFNRPLGEFDTNGD
ncbi:MAG: hypothetical protein WBX11_03835 [Thiobacillaceae bacterium]